MNIKFKNAAKALKKELAENHNLVLPHSSALNLLARTLGSNNYNTIKAVLGDSINIDINNNNYVDDTHKEKDFFFSLKDVDFSSNQSNYLLGRNMVNGKDIFIDNINQNIGIFGTTGSGLYVTILNMLKQVLIKETGTMFIDGSGDKKLLQEFEEMVVKGGRKEDFFVLDFSKNKDSSDINVFETNDLSGLRDIFVSYISSVNNAEDFFHRQAIDVLEISFGILEFLKSRNKHIDITTLSKALDLKSFLINLINKDDGTIDEDIVESNKLDSYMGYVIPKDYIYNDVNLSSQIVDYLATYNCKYDSDVDVQLVVPEQMIVQHGYSNNILKPLFKFIKKINKTSFDNIDVKLSEIFNANKIAYCLLPTLSYTKEEKSFLGKIVLGAIKKVYEDSVSNFDIKNNIEKKEFLLMFNAINSFIDGNKSVFKEILTTSRSMGVGCLITSQNTHTLSGSNEDNHFVDTVMSNMGTKIFLKNNDYTILNKIKLLLSVQPEKYLKDQLDIEDLNEITRFLNETSNGKGLVFSNKGIFKLQTPWYE